MKRLLLSPLAPTLLLPLAALALRLPYLNRAVLDWDESLYFLMAQSWHAGHLPYTAVWDNKPIGIYVIFALFQYLTPGVAAMRLAAALFVGGLSLTTFALTLTLTGERLAAWISGIAVLVCAMANDGLSANTELFMASFTALALLGALRGWPGLVVGLCLGCAFMVKYVAITEAPLVLAVLALRQRQVAPVAWAMLGAALPLLATIALYAAAGQLPLWFTCSILANFRRAAVPVPPGTAWWGISTQLMRWGTLYAATALLAAFRGTRMVALWLALALVGASAAKYFYDHYFLQALPPVCVGLGLFVSRLPRRAWLRVAVAAALLAPPAWAGWQAYRWALSPDDVRLDAAAITALHPQSLYVFDAQPILYALTGLPAPTRYVLPSVIAGNRLAPVAQISPSAELARILATNPQLIIRRDPPPGPDWASEAISGQLNAALAAHYHVAAHPPGAVLYQLNSN
jgi:4-amino-4-deoxy-L-arabinose transferase-like glycosyltransferase